MAKCLKPIWIQRSQAYIDKYVEVPCGRCLNCLERKRTIWTFRLLQELKVSESAKFVTLSYATRYLPINEYGYSTLYPDHLTKFFKDLRDRIYRDYIKGVNEKNPELKRYARRWLKQSDITKKWSPKLRYYACGEYSLKNTERPHYHIMLYNIPLDYIQDDPIHEEQYSSIIQDEIWRKGNVHIGKVERASAHYMSKHNIINIDWLDSDTRVKPFVRMSRKPGIGNNYINDTTRNYILGNKNSFTRLKNGMAQPLGRYILDRLFPAKKHESGIQLQSEERREITKKSVEFIKNKQNELFKQEIIKEEGDITKAEENLRNNENILYGEQANKLKRKRQKGKKL